MCMYPFPVFIISPHRNTLPSGELIAGGIPSPAALIPERSGCFPLALLPRPEQSGKETCSNGRSPPHGGHRATSARTTTKRPPPLMRSSRGAAACPH